MNTILHAIFTDAQDGIAAVESLLHHGMRAEDINLILPESAPQDAATVPMPDAAVRSTEHPSARQATTLSATQIDVPEPPQLSAVLPPVVLQRHAELSVASDASGYHYDALGAVIRDPVKPHATVVPPPRYHVAGGDTEQGAGLGLVFGLLAAMCVPGIGLIVGSGAIVAELMAAGTAVGGLAGGIFGFLADRGVDAEIARIVSDHLTSGGTTLSVPTTGELNATEITHIVEGFGGHLIHQPEPS